MSETPELAEMRQMIEAARKRFRSRCRAILRKAYEDADVFSTAIGEVSEYQAFDAWVKQVLQRMAESADAEAEAGNADDYHSS